MSTRTREMENRKQQQRDNKRQREQRERPQREVQPRQELRNLRPPEPVHPPDIKWDNKIGQWVGI